MSLTGSSFAVWLPRLVVILLGLHFGRGVLPFAPVEGDDQGIVNGLQAWTRGTPDFADAAYSYPIQPGSYHLLHVLGRFTKTPALTVFCITTAVCVSGFIFLASMLAARATGLRPAWVAVALLLMQEQTTTAFYANTNAIAGVVLMAGLVMAQRAERHSSLWFAGLLIGLGGWLRLDSLLLSPVVLALRLAHARPRRAIQETAEVALVSCLVLLAACTASGLSLTESWKEFMGRDNFRHWQTLKVNGWLALGYVASATSMIGTAWLSLTRRWNLLLLVATGTGLTLAVYGGSFVSPKYFYYATPILLVPGLSLLAWLFGATGRLPRVLACGILLLYFGEALIGVQTASQFRHFDPTPPKIVLGPVVLAKKSITLGLAEGEIMPTMDGPRLRGGQLWAPFVWQREKSAMNEELARLNTILANEPVDDIITSTYLSFCVVDGWLRAHAYRVGPRQHFPGNPSSFAVDCVGPSRHFHLTLINQTEADSREFSGQIRPGRRILFVNDRGGAEFRHLAPRREDWKLLSSGENLLLTLYEYRPE